VSQVFRPCEPRSFYCLCRTPFGPVAVVWSVHQGQPKIRRVLLSRPGVSAKHLVKASFPDSISSSCAEVDVVTDQIVAFLTGDDVRFSLDIIRLDLCSRFQQRVLHAEYGIPRGHVSTYQRIARYLGNANGARAIRSDGALGGYQGGLKMKRALLEMEGVLFDDVGHVLTEEIFYRSIGR
jgi:methylated-DNA-[protein]-cysteine S-methyltransferase